MKSDDTLEFMARIIQGAVGALLLSDEEEASEYDEVELLLSEGQMHVHVTDTIEDGADLDFFMPLKVCIRK